MARHPLRNSPQRCFPRQANPRAYGGTLGWSFGGKHCPADLTTEDAVTVQRRLADLVSAGAEWVAMETSSHALDQDRVADVVYDVAVFTNLTRDHLDYHGTMERYAAAKRRLFELADAARRRRQLGRPARPHHLS